MKRYFCLTLALCLFFLLFSFHSGGQNATIKGFVYENKTGEPVIFTNVYLFKTNIGATTDINGFFLITKIPPGTYDLMVTYLAMIP